MKKAIVSLAAVFYLIGCFLFLVIPEQAFVVGVSFIIALFFTVLSFYFYLEDIKEFVKSTYGKNLMNNFTSFFLLFCILAITNFIVFKKAKVWDLSARQLNTLSEQTVNTVKSLDEKTELVVFSNKASKDAILSLLELYKNLNPSIVTKYYDPETRPDMIAHYGVTVSPSIAIAKGDKKVIVTRIQEIGITNGLIRAQREKDPVICFNYHSKFQDSSDNGFTGLLHVLKQSAYQLNIVDLLTAKSIPQSCSSFVIIEPVNDFTSEQISTIETYLLAGGSLMTATMPSFHGEKLPKLKAFLAKEGIKVHNDIVIDMDSSLESSKGTAPIIARFDDKKINSEFKERVFFPLSSSVSPNTSKDRYFSLASTSPKAWAEFEVLSVVTNEAKQDLEDTKGPLDMAAAVLKDGRPYLVSLGNTAFISNKFFSYQSNFKFISNIFHWISGQDQLVSLNNVVFKEKPLLVSEIEKKIIFYLTIVILPLMYLVLALVFYQRRRFSS